MLFDAAGTQPAAILAMREAPAADAAVPASRPVPVEHEKPPAPASATTIAGGSAGRGDAPVASKYQRFDALLEPGNTSTYPGSEDTVTQDMSGYRTWLADRDIGFRSIMNFTVTLNPLPTGQPSSPQRYNGQQLTLNTASQNFEFTWRAASIGLPDTQFFLGANNTFTSYFPNGPSSRYIRNLGVFQSFLDGKLTIKAGITPNYYEYVGLFVGGSPILASGIPGLLPVAAGLGADPANVPLINVTAYGSHGKYLRFGVQRSTSVRGLPDEVASRHDIGLNFTLRDAGPLYIGEMGIRRAATAEGKQIWLRAGGFYNDSDYRRFDGGGTSSNALLYALADRQMTQPDRGVPARGVYLGGSVFWIPKSVNTTTRSYEARVYSIGALASRPKDTLTFRVTYNRYSSDAAAAQRRIGVYANDDQLNITGSYSAHATHGLYVTPGFSYVIHPSFTGDFRDALITSITVFLIV